MIFSLNIAFAQDTTKQDFSCDMDEGYLGECLLSWSPNGEWIATTTKRIERVDIWNLKSESLLRSLSTHADVLTWNYEGNLLATVTEYSISIWDIESGEQINTIDFEDTLRQEVKEGTRTSMPERFTSVGWNENTSQIAVVTLDWLAVWDVATDEFVVVRFPQIYYDKDASLAVSWSPSGDLLAVGFTSGQILIYNSLTLEVEKKLDNNLYFLNAYRGFQSITWSPDDSFLAIDGINASKPSEIVIRVYELNSSELIVIEGHKSPINALAWNPNGKFIASAGGDDFLGTPDNTVRIWDAETYESVREVNFETSITAISWNPTGTQLAAVDFEGDIYIIDIE
jgi:WD40 repeat protein